MPAHNFTSLANFILFYLNFIFHLYKPQGAECHLHDLKGEVSLRAQFG